LKSFLSGKVNVTASMRMGIGVSVSASAGAVVSRQLSVIRVKRCAKRPAHCALIRAFHAQMFSYVLPVAGK
jgi:hypothetical protein